jgi:hypothetical protein
VLISRAVNPVKTTLPKNYSNCSKRLYCCYNEASGQYILRERKEKWYSAEQRPYCANCGKLKGSKEKDCYYPERPCSNCGSTKTKVKDYNHNEMSWEKWVAIENEAAIFQWVSGKTWDSAFRMEWNCSCGLYG